MAEPSLSERSVLFQYLDCVGSKFGHLAVRMMNGVTAFSKLNPALALIKIDVFCMGAGFIVWVVMAFLDLAAGTQLLETVVHVMEGLNEHVLPALQFLNGLLALLVGFSILLDFLNIGITIYVNSNSASIINPNTMSTLSLRSKMIRALPKAKYGCFRRSDDVNMNDSSSSSCAICLGCLGEEDEIRILPNCRHYFHISCVDRWLLPCTVNNSSCPLCRATVICIHTWERE